MYQNRSIGFHYSLSPNLFVFLSGVGSINIVRIFSFYHERYTVKFILTTIFNEHHEVHFFEFIAQKWSRDLVRLVPGPYFDTLITRIHMHLT